MVAMIKRFYDPLTGPFSLSVSLSYILSLSLSPYLFLFLFPTSVCGGDGHEGLRFVICSRDY